MKNDDMLTVSTNLLWVTLKLHCRFRMVSGKCTRTPDMKPCSTYKKCPIWKTMLLQNSNEL